MPLNALGRLACPQTEHHLRTIDANTRVGSKDAGMEGLLDDVSKIKLDDKKALNEGLKAGGNGNDEWEVLQHDADAIDDEEVAIRVDQYLVVFLKVC